MLHLRNLLLSVGLVMTVRDAGRAIVSILSKEMRLDGRW